jgi:hypothetical protein
VTDWPKLTRAQCADLEVPGGVLPVHPALAPIFHDLAHQYHATVEPLEWPGCWGWAGRNIAGTSTPSRHWLGTAIDLNAPKHPQGVAVSRTFTRAEMTACARLEARYGGLIEWGGTWALPDTDGMHWQLADGVTFAQVTAWRPPAARPPAAVKVDATTKTAADLTGTGPGLRGDQGATGPRVRALQAFLNRYAPAYSRLAVDGAWGPRTSAVLREFARRSGIGEADGANIGPKIAAALYRAGFGRTVSAARLRAGGHAHRSARR